MGKSASAPPTPDYVGAAKEQGAANVESARASAKLSNPNIYGPLGSQTVTYGTPSFDQAGYDKAMANFRANQDEGVTEPTREQFATIADADTPTIRQTLTPEAQATLDAQQRVQKALAGLGEQGIGTAQSVLGQAFNPNLPGIQTS